MCSRQLATFRATSAAIGNANTNITIGLLPDTENCRLRMRRECRESFPAPEFKRNR